MNVVQRIVPFLRAARRAVACSVPRRGLPGSLALVLILLAGCTPVQAPAAQQSTGASATESATESAGAPVTLRLAVPEDQGRTLTPYVLEFVDQVSKLSNGSLTVEPVWNPTSGPRYEQDLVQGVLDGDFDLGVIATRSWDDQDITSLHVLQAPFLITDDALAAAVATSDVGTRLLDSLSSVGAVGLTIWPEDLRHPFSEMPGKPVLAPADFAGVVVRGVPVEVAAALFKALGADTMKMTDSGYQVAESGFLNGYTLMGKPIATGNITFYPKFDVIFANSAAFAGLDAEQQAALRQGAAAAQAKAIAEHPKEADTAAAWCADGGAVALASPEQLAAFEKAAEPVYAQLEQDPLNAELIAAIRDLKAHTTPASGATACGETAAAPTPAAAPVVIDATDATHARLRLANWVYGTSATDMYVDGQIGLLGNNQHPLSRVRVGYVTGFLYLEPGKHSVAVVPGGKGLDEAMIALDVDLEAGHRYTVGVMGQKGDDQYSPLVIDETAAEAGIPDASTKHILIYVNNVEGQDHVYFLEDGIGPTDVSYGEYQAAVIKSGLVGHLVVTANGGEVLDDSMRNFYEMPSGVTTVGFAGHAHGATDVYESDWSSDLDALDLLKQFGTTKVVWNDGVELSFNTFLDAVDKAGLNDLLTSGTYLIFAPTDAAFAAMPKEQLDALMADPQALADFVRYHLVAGYYPVGSLSGSMFGIADNTVTNLQGAELKLAGNLTVNSINMPGQRTITGVDGTRIVPVTQVLAPLP